MSGIQALDQAYLTGIYEQLTLLEVHLDDDPLAYGPKRLNQKTALVRKMLTDCERVFLGVSRLQADYKRHYRAAKVILDVGLKHLLANEPNVRAGRAVSEREAIAYGMLKAEVQAVADAENAIQELEAVMLVIKAKRNDLKDIQGRLRDQVRLCQEEINLGGRWGSKNPRGVELQPGQGYATGMDVAAIEKVIETASKIAEAEIHLPVEADISEDSEDELAALTQGLVEAEEPTPASLPEEAKTLLGGTEAPAGFSLGGTSDEDEIASFLSQSTGVPATPKPNRYTVQESEGMDLESILAKFN